MIQWQKMPGMKPDKNFVDWTPQHGIPFQIIAYFKSSSSLQQEVTKIR